VEEEERASFDLKSYNAMQLLDPPTHNTWSYITMLYIATYRATRDAVYIKKACYLSYLYASRLLPEP